MMFGQRQLEVTGEQQQLQQQQLLLYQYRCLSCGTILKETDTHIDTAFLLCLLQQLKERCIGCDSLLQEQTIEQVKVHCYSSLQQQQQEQKQKEDSSSIPPPCTRLSQAGFKTAYNLRLPRLAFDIPKLDSLLNNLADKGDGLICVTSSSSSSNRKRSRRKDDDDDEGNGYHYYYDNKAAAAANTLVTRLCVRALMLKKQGGFESPAVIFVDASNCSDIYQCVNFARQYGMDIDNMLNRIIVSRPFTIHQVAGLIVKELEEQITRSSARLVIISDILKMFDQDDPQLDLNEGKWLIREISRSLRKISTYTMVVVIVDAATATLFRDNRSSSGTNVTVYLTDNSLLLKIFDARIHLIEIPPSQSSSKSPLLKVEVLYNHRDNDSTSTSTVKTIKLHQKELLVVPAR